MKNLTKSPICEVDWDECYVISGQLDGEESDHVLFDMAQGPDGWYLSIDLDCNSAHFTETICRDDGPYESEDAALFAGFDSALSWFFDNEFTFEQIEIEDDLMRFAWWKAKNE